MNPLMQSMIPSGNAPVQTNNNLSELVNIANMVKNGNPQQIAMSLMQKNPEFKAFVDRNKGKTPQQVAKENGIDLNQIASLLK